VPRADRRRVPERLPFFFEKGKTMCSIDGCGRHKAMPPIVIRDRQRRDFLKGVAALPLAAVLFDPALARAQASRLEDISIDVPGGIPATGALAMPDTDNAPALMLFPEWWGLNDQIKSVAAEFAKLGFIAFAFNLFNAPPVTTFNAAKEQSLNIDTGLAHKQSAAAIDWLRNHPKCSGKVGTIGWCFGGGWSLYASVDTPVDATVIYYGPMDVSVDQLKALKGPVLGNFGTEDKIVPEKSVEQFEAKMATAGKAKDLTVYWYDAGHAFANPSDARYDAPDTRLAWERTLTFLQKNVG
jgi:carboxymethylenebutenolidase